MAYGRGVLCFVFLFISLLIYRIGSVLPSSPFQVSVLSNVGDGSGDAFVSRINENVERYGAGFQNTSAVAETYARVEFAPVKRAISDDDWRDAICKGGLLMQLTIGTNEQAQQALDYHKPGTNLFSQFTSSEDLDKNGWQQRELEQADAFQDLAFEVGQSVMEEIGAEPEDVDGATEWRHLGHTDQWNVRTVVSNARLSWVALISNSFPVQTPYTRTIMISLKGSLLRRTTTVLTIW